MKIYNVNCTHRDGYGFCKKKKKVFFGMFKPSCEEATNLFDKCEEAERYSMPEGRPPLPPPKKP